MGFRACLQTGAFCGSCSDPRLLFAIPVVEMVGAAQHVVLVACPDADLVAVRVLGDAYVVLRRDDGDARRLVGSTDEMRAVRPDGETDDVAGLERALARRRAKYRRAREAEDP